LRAARRRYNPAPYARPALDDATSYVGLFTLSDLSTLARVGYWPLPPRALEWIAERPRTRKRRRRRLERRVADVVRAVLAEELPEALDVILLGRKT
jgi:hypothetical protein